ncbi:ABC-type Zn uptake system ZnuABC Zn-binding protein ZnuA [Paenibacillus sp. DS2015]|uniref:hypothetical protein n=1 Tax=Paenibacillus sp. DS2015 TaxID=3373917 RepID=UPI003D1B1717
MNETVQLLEERVEKLENEVSALKKETRDTLEIITNKFSSELEKIMDDYRAELNKIAIQSIGSYKQH